MKYGTLLSLVLLTGSAFAGSTQGDFKILADEYRVSSVVISDYVKSYNFKCPDELTSTQLTDLLSRLDEDTELSVMLETDEMQWRDLYVEARSLIGCFTKGDISRSY